MGDTPTTVNQAAKTVNSIINFAIYDVSLKAAETAIVAEVPFLGLPVVNSIFTAVMRYLGGYVYRALALNATFVVITLQTEAEKTAYAAAEAKLRAAHLTGDPSAIQAATDEFKKAFRSLVHFDGAATP